MRPSKRWRKTDTGILVPAALRSCPLHQLKSGLFAVNDLLSSITRAKDPAEEIHADLVDGLQGELRDRLKDMIQVALEQVGPSPQSGFTEDDLENVVDAAGAEFNDGWIDAVSKDVQARIEEAYLVGREHIMDTLGTDVVLGDIDHLAQAALAGDSMFWIGDCWDQQLGQMISDTIRETVIEQGLSRGDGANALETIFGDDFPDMTENYWGIVSSSGVSRARTFGTLGSFEQAGVQTFRFRATDTNRTCEVCMYLNGRIFQVSDAAAQRDDWMAAKSPEEAKEVHPWPRLEDVQGLDNEELVEEGYLLPPLHGFCMCVLLPERFADIGGAGDPANVGGGDEGE